jgi:YidC/Oxa1 family membrane protein insertase
MSGEQALTIFRVILVLLICWLAPVHAFASGELEAAVERFNREGDFAVLAPHVIEVRQFYGLAAYYNGVRFFAVSAQGVDVLAPDQTVSLAEGQWFVAAGRFRSAVLDFPQTPLEIGEETFRVLAESPQGLDVRVARNDRLHTIAPELDQLRYAHLWWPIDQLARAVEWSLAKIHATSGLGWGWSIVLFTVILKILLVPLGILTVRMQRRVSIYQGKLAPVLAEIKEKYDGEEAHKRIMAAHKELGITTFYVLKPMLAMFIQIPIWVAVFNALGEMPQLEHAGFLWFESLAYPDAVAKLPLAVPLFGDSVSLLPLLMTAVTVMSAVLFRDHLAPESELKRQKRNLYLIALAFFVLFYPFPAGMVLYWTLSNALQIVQQSVIKV